MSDTAPPVLVSIDDRGIATVTLGSRPDRDYGYLVEGDRGSLAFQGTRFLSFSRD